jgi:hypothetical protein
MRRALVLFVVLVLAACEETTRLEPSPSGRPSEIVAPTARATTPAPTTPAPTTAAPSPSPTRTTTPPPTASSSPAPTTTTPASSPSPAPTAATPPGAAPVLGACADEPGARPAAPGATVPIVFSNQSGGARDVLSLDAQGRRVLARSLANGAQYTQSARVGDVWIVSAGGACVALYRVTAAALLISQASRQSLVPLYAIAGIVTNARTGAALSGQTVTIWQPDASACASEAGAVVSSITGADGTYRVWVTPGSYKIRVRASAGYVPQWWSSRLDCASATAVAIDGDTFQVNFSLQPQ